MGAWIQFVTMYGDSTCGGDFSLKFIAADFIVTFASIGIICAFLSPLHACMSVQKLDKD